MTDTFFAKGFAMNNSAQKILDIADLDRTLLVTGDQLAVGYDDTVYDTSGILLINNIPYTLVLPAGYEFWAKGPTDTNLFIWVGGSTS